MENYLIIHGSFGSCDGNWFPWLKEKLMEQSKQVNVPQMPIGKDIQTFENWSKTLKEYNINENTTIIAHSIAPIFVCKYLITNKIKVKKLIFVCGFNNFAGTVPEIDYVNKTMFIDNYKDVKKYCNDIICFYTDNDQYIPYAKEKEFADNIANEQILIAGGGHLNSENGYLKFEEILKFI